ncbi:MAG: glycoside hydrolase family 5 protein [Gaiellaceae bacterium]
MSFEIHRGTNVSHWLSQSDRRGEERRAWFTRGDVERIAASGFDHIRIPVDEEQLWDENDRQEPEAFGLLEQALGWVEQAGLRAVVDLHVVRAHHFNIPVRPLFTDPAAVHRFLELWRDLSAALGHWSVERLAYEILNEPVAPEDEDWNRVAGRAFSEMRRREPERVIALGSNSFEETRTFPALRVPDDERLILTFHFYDPMLITHYRAPWTPIGDYEGPVRYPGEIVSPEVWDALPEDVRLTARGVRVFEAGDIETLLAPVLAVRKETGLPLWCGEFGALPTLPGDVRERWYRDILAAFSRHGVAWTNWDYKGDFGLFTADGEPTAIHSILASTS